MSHATGLPRLAYVADVNVQNYCHGSPQLYRLLEGCAPQDLMVVETTLHCSPPDRRLPGVLFRHHRPPWARLFYQHRFPGLSPWLVKIATLRWREFARLLRPFRPEALLTVPHGFSWLAVSELARRWKIPLHMIVHDDWPRHPSFSEAVRAKLDPVFCRHYRRAASRMCVSAYMEEAYRKACDAPGTILYPIRFADLAIAQEPPPRLARDLKNLTLAFAGTLHSGQIAPLRTMVDLLHTMKGRLLFFGPTTEADLQHAGLAGSHVEVRGMVPSPDAMIEKFRAEADLLYAPAPFAEQWRGNASLGFPSKLADYSAAGLPMLVHGPSWSSAVRWARTEPDAAIVVDSPAMEPLADALSNFEKDADFRMKYAQGAIEAGNRCFSVQAAMDIFRGCLA